METSIQPYLEIYSPEGLRTTFVLSRDQDIVTIGREGHQNNLPLADPDLLISRCQCRIERKLSGWRLVEHRKNSTSLREDGKLREILGQESLTDQSTFCILGRVSGSERRYWTITLHDPEKTRTASPPIESISLKYDRLQGRLFRVKGQQSEEIGLTPLEHKLIRFMSERNREARNAPVLCTNDELLEAIYEPSLLRRDQISTPGTDNLRHIVHGLRQKIELDFQKPQFIVTHARQGYILYMYPSQ